MDTSYANQCVYQIWMGERLSSRSWLLNSLYKENICSIKEIQRANFVHNIFQLDRLARKLFRVSLKQIRLFSLYHADAELTLFGSRFNNSTRRMLIRQCPFCHGTLECLILGRQWTQLVHIFCAEVALLENLNLHSWNLVKTLTNINFYIKRTQTNKLRNKINK